MKTEKKLKIEKTKRKKTLHYEGESTKNSVVCGAAGVEFALELCVGSSDAVWNALAKRLKVNCGVCRLFCFNIFHQICTDSDEIFSEFRRIFEKVLRIPGISEFLMNSSNIS